MIDVCIKFANLDKTYKLSSVWCTLSGDQAGLDKYLES